MISYVKANVFEDPPVTFSRMIEQAQKSGQEISVTIQGFLFIVNKDSSLFDLLADLQEKIENDYSEHNLTPEAQGLTREWIGRTFNTINSLCESTPA